MAFKLKLPISFLIFLACLCLAQKASALTCNDQADGNWNNAATWSCGKIPDNSDDVTIDSNTVTLTGAQSAKSVTISGGTFNMGSYTLTDWGNWAYSSGTVNASTSRLQFTQTGGTFTPGNIQYYDVENNVGGGYHLIVSGTTTVTHNLYLTGGGGTLDTGTLNLAGNLSVTAGVQGGSATIRMTATTDQTITDGTSGYFPHIEINKPSGAVILSGTILLGGNWTWTNGPSLNTSAGTLEFYSPGNSTFTPNSIWYGNVLINVAPGNNLTVSGTANVNDLSIINSDSISTGAINVNGNFSATNANGGSALIRMVGTGNQTFTHNGTGQLPNVEINKPSGILTLSGTIVVGVSQNGNWTWSKGELDAGTSTIKFNGANTNIIPGNVRYYNVDFSIGGSGLNLQGDLTVANQLSVSGGGGIVTTNGKTIRTKDYVQTNSSTLNAGSSAIIITGNFTHTSGTFSYGTSVVAFQGTNQTITGTTTFYRLYKLVNAADTLTIAAGTGITIAAGGMLRLWGKPEGGTLALRSSQNGNPYTITPTGAFEAVYVDFQDASSSAAITAAASNDSGGNTRLAVTKEFICTIRAAGGDYTTLSAWQAAVNTNLATSTTKVFAHTGLVGFIPDNSAVSGATSGASGTVIHVTATQILIKFITGTFQAGEKVWLNSDHNQYVIISDAGYGAIASAWCYNDWPSGLSDKIDFSGWTSDATHYLKVYVPVAQRNKGKIKNSAGNYAGFAVVANGDWGTFTIESDYAVIDGVIVNSNNYANGISFDVTTSGAAINVKIKNSIAYNTNLPFYAYINTNMMYIANCIGISSTGNAFARYTWRQAKLYNLTLYNNALGVSASGLGSAYIVVKNTISLATGYAFDGSAGFDSAKSTNNISSDSSAVGSNPVINKAAADLKFSSLDSGSEDLHIAANSAAQNQGADLSTDPDWPVIDDIDGQSRLALDPNSWSIGADQFYPATAIYYSVGQNTSDHKTGTSTVSVSGSTATFSVPETAPNMGVGDQVTYFPSTGILDNFNRSAGTNPNYLGSNWTNAAGAPLTISSNMVVTTNSSAIAGANWNTSTFTDCEAYADIPVLPANGAGLDIRSDAAGANGYIVEYGVGYVVFGKLVSSGFTQIGSNIVVTFSAGDSLGIRAVGNNFYVYRKTGGIWSQIGQFSDSTYTTAGYIGMFIENDNTAVLDNFGGGTITPSYISGKTSQTQWSLVTATGGVPANMTGATVISITHAFGSLEGAVDAGNANGAFDASHLNTTDLYTNNYQLNVPCYYDSGPDTATVTVQSWTTGAQNYIRIYTPTNTSSEANARQRHQGKWNSTEYNLAPATGIPLTISNENVRVEGLETYSTNDHGIYVNGATGASNVYISNTIVKGNTTASKYGLYLDSSGAASTANIWNNIIYDYNGTSAAGLYQNNANATNYLYNNTFSGDTTGVKRNAGAIIAKNNIAQNTTAGYAGSFDASSINNLSDHADAPGSNPQNSKTVQFVDATNKDFHLAPTDAAAKDAGVDLSSDPYLPFNTDIDGQTRPYGWIWDIGADEYTPVPKYTTQGTVQLKGSVQFN